MPHAPFNVPSLDYSRLRPLRIRVSTLCIVFTHYLICRPTPFPSFPPHPTASFPSVYFPPPPSFPSVYFPPPPPQLPFSLLPASPPASLQSTPPRPASLRSTSRPHHPASFLSVYFPPPPPPSIRISCISRSNSISLGVE